MNAPRRAPRQKVDGVILLDKPSGITSNAALQRVRRVFNAAKGGHAGTLDPLASGLLPMCLGEATKFSQTLLDADKAYEAELLLGVRTDTGDAEGSPIETRQVTCNRSDIESVCAGFLGEIDQVPPMHSALKVAGRPLYDYARSGISLDRKARRIRIGLIDVLEVSGDRVRIAVDCSKGTYIRVLAEDIGAQLGCGAHLTGLRRTRIGRFRIEEAVVLSRLEEARELASDWLRPTDHLLADWPSVRIASDLAARFCHGQRIGIDPMPAQGATRVYAENGVFLGAGTIRDGLLVPARLVSSAEPGQELAEPTKKGSQGIELTAKTHV